MATPESSLLTPLYPLWCSTMPFCWFFVGSFSPRSRKVMLQLLTFPSHHLCHKSPWPRPYWFVQKIINHLSLTWLRPHSSYNLLRNNARAILTLLSIFGCLYGLDEFDSFAAMAGWRNGRWSFEQSVWPLNDKYITREYYDRDKVAGFQKCRHIFPGRKFSRS